MKELIGTEASLKNGPRDMERKPFSGGSLQMIGEESILKPTPSRLQEFSKGVSGGTVQEIGQMASLKEGSAFHGWQSHPTPVSKRTSDQSK